MQISDIHMKHEGGTKFYRVLLVSDRDRNSAVVMFQWGRVGVKGQTKLTRYETSGYMRLAHLAAQRQIDAKRRRLYDVDPSSSFSGDDSLSRGRSLLSQACMICPEFNAWWRGGVHKEHEDELPPTSVVGSPLVEVSSPPPAVVRRDIKDWGDW